jgi:hypothetical protein
MRINKLVVINNNKLDSTDNENEDEEAKATRSSVNLSSAKQDANPYSTLLT